MISCLADTWGGAQLKLLINKKSLSQTGDNGKNYPISLKITLFTEHLLMSTIIRVTVKHKFGNQTLRSIWQINQLLLYKD